MNIGEKQNFLVNFAFGLTVLGIVLLSLKFMTAYLLPFVIGVIIAHIVQKPARAISPKIKLKKEFCALILSVLVYIAMLIVLSLLTWLLVSKVDLFLNYLTGFSRILKDLTEKINAFTKNFSYCFDGVMQDTTEKLVSDTISGFGTKITAFISGAVTSLIKDIPAFFVSAVVTVVASSYIAKDYDKLKKFIIGIIKVNTYRNAVIIKNIFTDCILKLALGYLLIMSITFIELLAGFFVLGIKNFFVIALIVSLIDILPVLGTGTVLLPWSVILFLNGNYKFGFGIITLYVIISIVRNFAEPKIIGKQMGVNPLFTLLFMFLGLKLAGVAGMILLPVVLIIAVTFYKRQISADEI